MQKNIINRVTLFRSDKISFEKRSSAGKFGSWLWGALDGGHFFVFCLSMMDGVRCSRARSINTDTSNRLINAVHTKFRQRKLIMVTSDRRMLVVIDQQLCMIANIDVFYYKYFSTMYVKTRIFVVRGIFLTSLKTEKRHRRARNKSYSRPREL